MAYDKNFVEKCEVLFKKIKQNRPIQECLNTATTAAAKPATDPYDSLWFVYYMFFAIHNPKMEDYIQKKTSTSAHMHQADIIKNMIKRRNHTSTIVFQLYTHAYTNKGNVTHIYPKYKDKQLIKSYQFNHLKTTSVLIRRFFVSSDTLATAVQTAFIEYVIATAPTIAAASTSAAVINKINKDISYKRKDLIVLTLACYMKIDEQDINQKNIFIAATPEEINQDAITATRAIAATEPEIPSTSVYDEKYKYLYT
jgi:hypothetical protein